MDLTWLIVLALAVWFGYRMAAARSRRDRTDPNASWDVARTQAEVSAFGKECGRRFLQDVDREVVQLRSKHELTGDVPYNIAVAEGSIWTVSVEGRSTPEPILDLFFRSFWPEVHYALRTRFGNSAETFNAHVEELAQEISDALVTSPPDQAALGVGRVITRWLAPSGDPAPFSLITGLGIVYTTKLTATAQMLDQFGTVVAQKTNSV